MIYKVFEFKDGCENIVEDEKGNYSFDKITEAYNCADDLMDSYTTIWTLTDQTKRDNNVVHEWESLGQVIVRIRKYIV